MFRRILLPALVLAVLAVAAWGLFFREAPREVTTDSDDAYSFYVEGIENREKFFWAEALDSFEKSVQADSSFAMAWVELAVSCRNLENSEGCKEAVAKAYALRDGISEMERFYVDYYHALYTGEYEQANLVLDEMGQKYPDDIRSVQLRAQRAWAQGDDQQAIALYEKALKIDPSKVMSHNQLGYLYLRNGDYETAIANLRRYAYYAEDQPNPHDSLGEAYEAAGEYDQAIQEYLKALEIRPDFYHSAYHLAQPFAITGQMERARYMLKQAKVALGELGIPTDYHPIRRMRIEAMGMCQENVIAIADEVIAKADPEKSSYMSEMLNAHTFRTFSLLELDRLDEADAELETTLGFWKKFEEKSSDREAEAMMAKEVQKGDIITKLLVSMRNVKRGEEYLDTTNEIASALSELDWPPHEMAPWRHDLARIYYLGGEYDRAQEQLEKVLADLPNYPYSNLLMAYVQAKLGRHEKALDYLAVYLQVMRNADEDHKGMQMANELYEELS